MKKINKGKDLKFSIVVLLLAAGIFLWGCKKDESPKGMVGGYFFEFVSRTCDYLSVVPGKKISMETLPVLQSGSLYGSITELKSNILPAKDFCLSVKTCEQDAVNRMDKKMFDVQMYRGMEFQYLSWGPGNGVRYELTEEMIRIDYDKYYSSLKKSGTKSGMTGAAKIIVEYRSDGLKNITVSAPNTVLFGRPPGESLNDYFSVEYFFPQAVIISSVTTRLLYGPTNWDKAPVSINEWLALSPTAPACVILKMNEIPQELPADVQFEVTIETSGGKIVKNVSETVHLTK